jgi:hypothetical protein
VDITTFCVVELCPLICKQSQVLFNKVLLRQTFYLDLLNNDFNHNTHVRMLLLFLLWFPELCPLTDQCQILFPFTTCFEIFTQFFFITIHRWSSNLVNIPLLVLIYINWKRGHIFQSYLSSSSQRPCQLLPSLSVSCTFVKTVCLVQFLSIQFVLKFFLEGFQTTFFVALTVLDIWKDQQVLL